MARVVMVKQRHQFLTKMFQSVRFRELRAWICYHGKQRLLVRQEHQNTCGVFAVSTRSPKWQGQGLPEDLGLLWPGARVTLKSVAYSKIKFMSSSLLWPLCIRLGRKGVNFGNSLTATGVCYMGSKAEDIVKYFWKRIVFTYTHLDLKFM